MLKIFCLLFVVTGSWAGLPEPSEYVRPCVVTDKQCIRDNLAANSKCSRAVKGFIPSEYSVKESHFEAPSFNATYIEHHLIVRNHDKCFVSDFVANVKKDTARLVVDCPFLDLEADRELVQHWSFQEDTYYFYHIRGLYPRIRMSVYLNGKNNMDLCKSRVFTEVTALPILHIDPKDRSTENFLSRDLTMLNVFEREAFYYGGYSLLRKFVDSVLCDFGCPRQLITNSPLYY